MDFDFANEVKVFLKDEIEAGGEGGQPQLAIESIRFMLPELESVGEVIPEVSE